MKPIIFLNILSGVDRLADEESTPREANHEAFRVEGEDVPRTFHQRVSPHQIGLSDVLATALITDTLPAKIVMFGVEPHTMKTGLALTPVVEAGLDKLVETVVAELHGLGHAVNERENPPPRRREWSPG